MNKFTFKKHIPTGRFRSFELDYTDIKLNKKIVGSIRESREDGSYHISFMIKKDPTEEQPEEQPAQFKWIFLKKKFDNELDARKMIKNYEKEIQEKYDLYMMDD